jgi:DNA-binding transcriptional LysR family regulator
VRLPGGYYLVRPRHRPVSVAMRRFRDWILAELAAAAETDG